MKDIQKAKDIFPILAAEFFLTLMIIVMLIGVAAGSQYEPQSVAWDRMDEPINEISLETVKPTQFYYDVPLSEDLQDYIFEVSEEYGVPADMIIAIIEQESNYTQMATGTSGEQGYMQIHPINLSSLSDKLGVSDLYDARQNILCGVYLLSQLSNKYETRNEVLMCYNCGERGASRLWEQGVTETEYCRKIADIIDSLAAKN